MKEVKTEEDIKKEEQEYLSNQKIFNKTGDLNILWGPMYNYILETAESCARKIVPKNGWINKEGLNDLVNFSTDKIIERYIRGINNNKPYSKDYPITMIYLTVRSYAWLGVGTTNKKQSKAVIFWDWPIEYDLLSNIEDVDELED